MHDRHIVIAGYARGELVDVACVTTAFDQSSSQDDRQLGTAGYACSRQFRDIQSSTMDETQDLVAIVTRRVAGAVVVTIAGEVDILGGSRLRAELREAVDGDDDGPVVVDLTGVTLLSSTGLAVLVDARWHAREHGREVVLAVDPGSRAVPLALHAAGIASLFPTVADVEEAVSRGT
jgi:anti-sigma B factor antagonist